MSRAPSCKKCGMAMVQTMMQPIEYHWACDNEQCAECDQPVYLPGSNEEERE